jgi:hypothetical protein
MTESPFPFEAPAEEPAADENRKKLVLVAGAGALAVAVLGYFVVLPALSGSGGDSDTSFTVVKHKPAKTVAAKAAAKPAAKKVVAPTSYNDVQARNNPFHPLWIAPKEQPVVAPAGVTAPTGTDTTGTDTTGTSSGSSTSVGGQRVALMTVYSKDGAQYAQTKVGDVVYAPKVGAVFAGSYKLLATSGNTATFLFGDEQFTLTVGQEVLK